MEKINYNIHGIYDLRTLKFLKSEGVNSFSFDFNPRSFNFIQEYVFLELYKNHLSENDQIYLYFGTNSDYMISKLFSDMRQIRNTDNVVCVFGSVDSKILEFKENFIVDYSHDLDKKVFGNLKCIGLLVNFSYFEETYNKGILNNFCNNLYSRYPQIIKNDFRLILNLDWTDNFFPTLFESIDINIIQLNLNSDVEICYRNIDQEKLKREFKLKQKYLNF